MITKITHEYVKKDYSYIKNLAINALNKKKYHDTLKLIETAAKLAYHLNFRYADDEFEGLLQYLSDISLKNFEFSPIKNRYVFYDYFGIDNKGLTQQYIFALKEWDVDFLYIMENSDNEEYAKEILEELSEIRGAEICIVPNNSDYIKKAGYILDKISQYRPEKAFLHLAPWSVLSIIVWNSIDNVTKYFIDITDHAFWLGKSCSDYFIGFREYGYVISNKYRGISHDKLITQHYFPVLSTYPFQGFPSLSEGKTIIFTGGSYYKVYGENNTFLNILRKIVIDNPSCIILFAGNGDSKPIEKFLKVNKIVDRVLLIGNRKDINEVFKHSDIYLNTFPIIGGLMSQYAVANKIPLIGYTDKLISCNYTEGIFNFVSNTKFTYTDMNDFFNEINLLISDKIYRDKQVNNYSNLIPTPELFSAELKNKLSQNTEKYSSTLEIDEKIFMNLYFYAENNFLHAYHTIKISTLKSLYFKYDFFHAILSFINVIYFNKDKIFKIVLKKVKNCVR